MLRIIAGHYRSRRLHSPPDAETSRPYGQRVREAVFNLLREWFEDANVLDLFAGVGTMGLEAASRGAARVTVVERDRRVFSLLQQNIADLGCGDRVRAVHGDALGAIALDAAPAPVDIVFMDPPYAMMSDPAKRSRVLAQAARVRSIMAPRSFLILRSPGAPDDMEIEGFDGPEVHRFGAGMWVLLYAPCADDPPAEPAT